ncbi:MAG: NAD(P)/FAD-dependent oxidoreductase [Gammaproteobacteria bacterium]|nr:NAD(P)/FAD-dependent oxidoreductase [Gammaproteobacteria bacterium]
MTNITRRTFITISAATVAASAIGFPRPGIGAGKRVVIVGGGIAGATAAKYLRLMDGGIDVTLIEPKKIYTTCFLSNEVLWDHRNIDSIQFNYDALGKHGVTVVHDVVTAIDPGSRRVTIKGGKRFNYDACVVSPGISFNWDAIENYTPEASQKLPHAYQAGPQTLLLRDQIKAMKDGGIFILVAPQNPFRCPPGPYERASQIAWYFKNHKPRSKIIILDPKPEFSKQALFTAAWERYFGYKTGNSMIEWIGEADAGEVTRVDVKRMEAIASSPYKGDVINVIPPQHAGKIALQSGLADDTGWCPVNHRTFESKIHKDIYVVGDAAIAAPMPKSGYSANSQAKVCAAAIIAKFSGEPEPVPSFVNTCYSLITPEHAISVAMVYNLGPKGVIQEVPGAGGLTPKDASDEMRKREVAYAYSWFRNITHDIFG